MGYVFGQRVGPALFSRPDSRFFKRANVDKAHEFFEQHGPRAIVLARFVPVVRTFTPITAGVSGMDYRTFVKWNVIGGTLWAWGVTLLGYFLGQVDVIEQNLELAILTVVADLVHPDRRSSSTRRGGRSGTPWSATWPTTSSILISVSSSTRPVTPTASSDAAAPYAAPQRPVATSVQSRR